MAGENIVINLLMRTGAFESGAQRASKVAQDTAKSITSTLSGIGAAVGVGFGVTELAGKLVSVQREFDVLNASLVTITGSSAAAQREFAWIRDFAATTPYAVNEVTEAFVKLKSLGLDATQETLRSFGNTASAMGKPLQQFIEAVADASTGEFERLKEFGIKARKQGDEVALTFQGVTTSIGNNAAAITEYLTRIGDVNFAGAMDERAKTLDGAISNLGDSWDRLFLTVSQSGIGDAMSDAVRAGSDALSGLTNAVEGVDMGPVMAGAHALALVLGGRLAASAAATATAFGAATVEALAYQAALARMSGASAAAAAGMTAMSVATTAASRAMALFGGPAGIVFIAVGALLTLRTEAGATAAALDRLSGKIDAARAGYASLSRDAAAAEQYKVRDAMRATGDESEKLRTRIGQLEMGLKTLPDNTNVGNWKRELVETRAELEAFNRKQIQYTKDLRTLEGAGKGLDMPKPGKSEKAMSDAQNDARGKFLDQYATKAEKFSAALKKAKADMGDLFTGADEQRLRDAFGMDKKTGGGGGSGGGGRSGGGGGLPKLTEAQRKAEQDYQQTVQEGARVFDETRTAAEKHEAALAKLAKLQAAGVITQDTYTRAVKAENADFEKGTEAYQARQKAVEDYLALIKDLRTEAERKTDILAGRLGVIDAAPDASTDDKAAQRSRAVADAFKPSEKLKLPQAQAGDFGGIGAAFKGLNELDEIQKSRDEAYEADLARLAEYREKYTVALTEFQAQELALAQQHADEMAQIQQARSTQQLVAAESVFGNLADMAKTYAGEQSGVYKTLFAIQKAAAIAQSIVAIQTGIAQAAALPFPANLGAMASVAAATASIISNISSVALNARATGGHVSQNQPYLVGERGPELFVPHTAGSIVPNDRLGGGDQGAMTVNLIEDRSRAGTTQQRQNGSGAQEMDVFVADLMGDGPRSRALQRAFGLTRRGY